jgi:hypothetical protein
VRSPCSISPSGALGVGVVQFGATAVSEGQLERSSCRRCRRVCRRPMHPAILGAASVLEAAVLEGPPSHAASVADGSFLPACANATTRPRRLAIIETLAHRRARAIGRGALRAWLLARFGAPLLLEPWPPELAARRVGARGDPTPNGSELRRRRTRDDVSWECRHRFAREGRAPMDVAETSLATGNSSVAASSVDGHS